ncbi:MAG: DUF4190 domain-containing protein [Lachnospiraceae bacterium]|nr:DUF4190 domain-containing protein [Lachnospiraceae bacterium]
MSDFENNGFDNAETVETVETVENVETIDPAPTPEYSAPEQETVYAEAAPENQTSVFAIISLVTGILSILCCCSQWICVILAVSAIVLGILSMNKEESGRGMAIAGIICGGVGLVLGIIVIIIGAVGGAASALDNGSMEDIIERIEDL